MSEPIIIRLTLSEMQLAAMAGVQRVVAAFKNGKTERYDAPGTSWQRHIVGAIGELALAKHLNVFWSGGNFSANADYDVGPHQVRATEWATGKLLIYPDDNDDQAYVLARINACNVELTGWLLAREGKQDHFWGNLVPGRKSEMFCVPSTILHPMQELPVCSPAR